MDSPNIRTMLDVSTAHLSPRDMEILEALASREEGGPPLRAYGDEYGWYVSVGSMAVGEEGEAERRLREAGFTDEFVALMVHARGLGTSVIRFDADADLEPGFATFDHVSGEKEEAEEALPAPGA